MGSKATNNALRNAHGFTRTGFTLIELMLVVALIAVIAVISIPVYTRTRISANEAGAVGAVRAICSAQATYHHIAGSYGDLNALATSVPPCIQHDLAAGEKHGYEFDIAAVTEISYECTAVPKVHGRTGVNGFFVDESGVIRKDSSGTATVDSDPIT